MMKRMMVIAAALLALGAGVFWWGVRPSGMDTKPVTPVMPDNVDLAEGKALYAENCASCHGANLEGQPDWQSRDADGRLPAPPHDETGHTWHHSDRVLFRYTKLGGRDALALQGVDFDSGMPGFGDQLSDAQIWNILAYIQSTWTARERAAQAASTEADLADEGG